MSNLEIERKFLVKKDLWEKVAKPEGTKIIQGYLFSDEDKTIRVRIHGYIAFLTIKGKTIGFSRPEFEYEIPIDEAMLILNEMTGNKIEKSRFEILHQEKLWEVDVFEGRNKGLILAEIELQSENEIFHFPGWIGDEVTSDKRYYNAYLSKNPYETW
jgi:CYTH domain-containing protein